MKLLLPDILRVMEEEHILPEWQGVIAGAERYIYESYGDVDEEVVQPVFETAREMIDYGFFHLPAPVIWIEDPWGQEFKDNLANLTGVQSIRHMDCRKIYFCREYHDRIEINGVDAAPLPPDSKKIKYQFFEVPQIIWLDNAKNPTDWRADLNTATTTVKQFVVTLATAQAVRERKVSDGYGSSVPKARRNLTYTNVRIVIPAERSEPGAVTGAPRGPQGKRKLHMVPGYMWGKNTRPREQQRWIAPFWRGDPELGVSGHAHYEVRKRPLKR